MSRGDPLRPRDAIPKSKDAHGEPGRFHQDDLQPAYTTVAAKFSERWKNAVKLQADRTTEAERLCRVAPTAARDRPLSRSSGADLSRVRKRTLLVERTGASPRVAQSAEPSPGRKLAIDPAVIIWGLRLSPSSY